MLTGDTITFNDCFYPEAKKVINKLIGTKFHVESDADKLMFTVENDGINYQFYDSLTTTNGMIRWGIPISFDQVNEYIKEEGPLGRFKIK